jgi:hypothetical protein
MFEIFSSLDSKFRYLVALGAMNFNYQKVVGKDNVDQKTWMTPLANLSFKIHCPKIYWLPTYKKQNLKLISLVA